MTLHVIPVELTEANDFVAAYHRHHMPVQGHRFSCGVVDDDGCLHGVAVSGRPVARLAGHPRDVLEVTRLCTDGTANACSVLYSAVARAGKALGFRFARTYILDTESGASLKASGWRDEGPAGVPWAAIRMLTFAATAGSTSNIAWYLREAEAALRTLWKRSQA